MASFENSQPGKQSERVNPAQKSLRVLVRALRGHVHIERTCPWQQVYRKESHMRRPSAASRHGTHPILFNVRYPPHEAKAHRIVCNRAIDMT